MRLLDLLIIISFQFINGSLDDGQFNKLENLLKETDEFFVNLKSEFELYPDNGATRELIDDKIKKFIESINIPQKISRQKLDGENYHAKGVDTGTWNENHGREIQMNYKKKIIAWCEGMLIDMPDLSGNLLNLSRKINSNSKLSTIQKDISREIEEISASIETKININDLELDKIQGKHLQALSRVTASSVKYQNTTNALQELIEYLQSNRSTSSLEFNNVTITSDAYFRCPIPSVDFETIEVKGFVNGFGNIKTFMDDLLKIHSDGVECQEITGHHSLANVETVDANVPPLDIGSYTSHQNIHSEKITVDELIINSGGLFLPRSHPGEYQLTGTLTVSEAKITKPIEIRGRMNGTGIENLRSIINHPEPIIIDHDFNRFTTVRILEKLQANDIVEFQQNRSISWIKANSLPLNSTDIPIHLKFRSDLINWNDVYVLESPKNWVTVKNPGVWNITSLKKILKNVKLPDEFKDFESIRKLENPICTDTAFAQGIYSSTMTIGRARIETINADNVIGGRLIDKMVRNALKKNSPRRIMTRRLQGPVRLKKLQVQNSLNVQKGFDIPIPSVIKRFIAKKNCNVDRINQIDVQKFINNLLTVDNDDAMSLINLTFVGELEVDEISCKNVPIDFDNVNKTNVNLGEKTILRGIEAKNVDILPFQVSKVSFDYDQGVNVIVTGNVTFRKEPRVGNINNKSVEKLLKTIWLKDQPAKLTGDQFNFNEMIVTGGNVEIRNSLNTPEDIPWSEHHKRIFSKSQDQDITQNFSFHDVEVLSNVRGSPESRIIGLPGSNLFQLEHHSFQKCRNNFLTFNNWHFTEISSSNSFIIDGMINKLNLSTDVVRTDVEENLIVGKKTIDNLIVYNISQYQQFNDLLRNMFNASDNSQLNNITITGQKTFRTLNVKDLQVTGKVAGKKIEDCLQLGANNQHFLGRKTIIGSLSTPQLLIESNHLINDVNFMNILDKQLKQNSTELQVILNPIEFTGTLKIIGNLTVQGRFQNLLTTNEHQKNTNHVSRRLKSAEKWLDRIYNLIERIRNISEDDFTQWNKLEVVGDENSTIFDSTLAETPRRIFLEHLGDCYIEKMQLICNEQHVVTNFSSLFNKSQENELDMVNLRNSTFLTSISSSSGGLAVFSYHPASMKFIPQLQLNFPDVSKGTVKTSKNALWIALEAEDQTILLRRDVWGEEHKFLLPSTVMIASDHSTDHHVRMLSHPGGEELLLICNDGIWVLGGISPPRKLTRKPLNNVISALIKNRNLYIKIIDRNNQTKVLRLHHKLN